MYDEDDKSPKKASIKPLGYLFTTLIEHLK